MIELIYGAVRISTNKQNMERQIRNILKAYPTAKVIKETYTGTKFQGRKDFENLIKKLQKGDILAFDSVSRMSRNCEEGCRLYADLFNNGVDIVFLKEPHINTSVYREALNEQIKIEVNTGNKATDDLVNSIVNALNKYTISLAFEQIRKCFEQAEKEVKDLHQRTKEGIETARLNGKQIGNIKGRKLITKKSKNAKAIILKHSQFFDGTLNDIDCMKLAGVAKNTYYKYKKELKLETT